MLVILLTSGLNWVFLIYLYFKTGQEPTYQSHLWVYLTFSQDLILARSCVLFW